MLAFRCHVLALDRPAAKRGKIFFIAAPPPARRERERWPWRATLRASRIRLDDKLFAESLVLALAASILGCGRLGLISSERSRGCADSIPKGLPLPVKKL